MKNNLLKHKILITPQEQAMIDDLLSLGFLDASEVLRLGLRIFYKEEFLKLPQKDRKPLKKKDPTPEELCIDDGGEIIIEGGAKKCKITTGSMVEYRVL
ncbi:MAG: hypothetical protein AAB907_00260 [Patescibacteria group bacterium]|mgnify:CR=1 FL=1